MKFHRSIELIPIMLTCLSFMWRYFGTFLELNLFPMVDRLMHSLVNLWRKKIETDTTIRSAMELFLVKRKIKGPSWLSISKFSCCPAPQRVNLQIWTSLIIMFIKFVVFKFQFTCNIFVILLHRSAGANLRWLLTLQKI